MSVVLVVDDEPQLLRTLQITLTARGHDVHTAATGRRAIAEATARPPDLVILDLGLPDIDGAEVINRLRAQSAVPIIVLSGRTSGATRSRPSTPAPTTTSPSPSGSRSCSPASGR